MPQKEFGWIPLSRREFVIGTGCLGAGTAASQTGSDYLTRKYQSVSGMEAQIRDLSLVSGEIEQGGVLRLNVLIENTGGETIEDLWTQMDVRLPDGTTYSPPNNVRTTLEPGSKTLRQLEWKLPDQAVTGEWELRTTIFTSAGYVFDATSFGEMRMTFNVRETVSEWFSVASESLWTVLKGASLGEIGVDWEVKHHDTFPYFLGWFGGSIGGPFDVIADTRDCAALDNNIGDNVLDCGGMIVSAVASGGTILGGLGAIIPEGFSSAVGIGIMSASIKLDKAEDTTDAARIITEYDEVGGNMKKVNDFLISKYGTRDVAGIVDELPPVLAKKLDEVSEFKIFDTPIDREATLSLARYENHFAGRHTHHIDEWPRIRKIIENPDEIWKREDEFKYWFVKRAEGDEVRAISLTDLKKIDAENPGMTLRAQTGIYGTRSWLTGKLDDAYEKIYDVATR